MLAKAPKTKKRPEPDAKIALGIRISPELKEEIDVLAKDEGRSFSNLIQRLLSEALSARKAGK